MFTRAGKMNFLSGQNDFLRGQDDFFRIANQPISVRHLSQPYNNTLYKHAITLEINMKTNIHLK